MWSRCNFLVAATVVLATISIGAWAQAPSDAPVDPFLEQVNAELDGVAASQTQPTADADANRTRGGLYYLRVVSALCLVVALILAAGYAVRRAGGSTPLLAGPNLGRILGRIYLSRNATMFFVETGGQVLVLGVTNGAVNTLATYDAAAFGSEADDLDDDDISDRTENFLRELGRQSDAFRSQTAAPSDTDIDTLRQDIERLQEYLREDSGEIRD